jgi:uncharacterized protein YccT (UPF0319 family)
MLSWCPEVGVDALSDKQMKFELMDKLFDVLENPEEYMQKGYRAAMIRFATVDNDSKSTPTL